MFVKKRGIFSIILAFALLLSFIPHHTVKADYIYVHSYEEWLEMKDDPGQTEWEYPFAIMGRDFQWPEENCEIVIEKQLYVEGSWTIPANVKVVNTSGSGVSLTGSLSVYGTWENTGSGRVNATAGMINVENGGRYVVAEDASQTTFTNIMTKSGGTLEVNYHSIVIEPGTTMTFESGAALTGKFNNITLGGTLKADGLVTDAMIDARVLNEGAVTNAALEGTMTVGSIRVSDGTLTIPAGSDITTKWSLSMADIWKQGRAVRTVVGGELTVNTGISCQTAHWGDGPDQVTKTLEILDGGVVNLPQGSSVNFDNGAAAGISGTGRLNVYGTIEGNRYYVPWIDGQNGERYSFLDDVDNGLAAAIEAGYIADTLTIWRSWQCDHQWVAGAVTAPTCTSEGYTTYTCSLCGAEKQDDIKEKLPHTPDGNNDCTTASYCTVCGGVIREAGEHAYGEGTVKTEASCTEPGVMEYTCEVCGDVKEETIPAKGHQWVSESEENFTKVTCSVCGEEQTIEFEKKDGIDVTLSAKAMDALAARAEKDGFTTYRISAEVVGSAGLTAEQKEALADLTDNAVLVEVTLEGITAVDGEETVVTLHELGDTARISVPYETEADMDTHVVKVCYLAGDGSTEEMDAVYEDGTVTFTTNHFSTYAAYTAEKPEVPVNPDDQNPDNQNPDNSNTGSQTPDKEKPGADKDKNGSENKTSQTPATGDSANLMLWAVLLAVSAAAGITVYTRKRA